MVGTLDALAIGSQRKVVGLCTDAHAWGIP